LIRPLEIGVAAVQGDFAAHAAMIERLGERCRLVRRSVELEGLDGLVLPGGESTTMLRFLERDGLAEALVARVRAGLPVFGTCAGLILLASEVRNPHQPSLGLLAATIERNGYGRQVDSFIDRVQAPAIAVEPLEGVFIRAPVILSVGDGVRVLGTCRGQSVLVEQDAVLACSYHPELTDDVRTHRYFVARVRERRLGGTPSSTGLESPAPTRPNKEVLR
jgi:5'-phosphate synthase pdxT subunit